MVFIGALPGILISALSYGLCLGSCHWQIGFARFLSGIFSMRFLDLGKISLLSRHSDGASNDQLVYSLGVKNKV